MWKLFAHPRFLAVYSTVLTVVFALTTCLNLSHDWLRAAPVSGAEQKNPRHEELDQLTVHRINIVEPDGTTRLVISDKAEFPGGFYMGKEFTRADRQEAGMLFNNDEGTENGGLLFGGLKGSDGKLQSFGHLSFDDYEQDQTLSLDTSQDGDDRHTSYQINDNIGTTLLTPEVIAAFSAFKAMPDGPAKQKAAQELQAKYPMKLRARATLARESDKSSTLRLRDQDGRTRILLRVAADGTPTMQFLDAEGKVTRRWPEETAPVQPEKK